MRRKDVKRSVRNFCKGTVVALAAAAVFTVAPLAQAELVTNGSFESTTNGNGQLGFNTDVTGWSVPAPSGSYTFVFSPGTADTSGAVGQDGNLSLWGPGNGSFNGLTVSPDGGNFLASDGAFQQGAITQTLNDLTAGDVYLVTFDWAAAQQSGFNGATTSGWIVDLGGAPTQSVDTGIPEHGFLGWNQQTFAFTADSTSDVLSFLAQGTPDSTEPPFALLDGVSVEAAPEPGTWVLMLTGILGAMVISRYRQWMKR
jgi:hypothetical protein